LAAKTTNSKLPITNSIMGELLASQTTKPLILFRGQQVEGEIVSKTDKEIILDLGTKSEGIISKRDIPKDQLDNLKAGDKLKAFVYMPENESGQVVLSLDRQVFAIHPAGVKVHPRGGLGRGGSSRGGKGRSGRSFDWFKFREAQNQKSKLQGTVMEVNKGGLIVEAAGARGFLPNSQVGFELLAKSGEGLDNLIGQNLTVTVIEVDQDNNKLIFSERGQISDDTLAKLKEFKANQKVLGKIVAILPFGLVVDIAGTEGLVFISDVSWEKVDDLQKQFGVGQELTVLVSGLDAELGRLNLSIKNLSEDPFEKLSEKYPADEVVKGTVIEVTDKGVAVKLEDPAGGEASGVEGFLPASKKQP